MYSGTTKSRTDLEIGIRHQHTSPQIMLSITNPRSRTSGYGAGSRCPSRAKTSHRLKTTKGRKTDPIAANAAFRVAASISSNETQDQPPPWLIQAANISSRGRYTREEFRGLLPAAPEPWRRRAAHGYAFRSLRNKRS